MNSWHTESLNFKKELIQQAWDELDIWHMSLSLVANDDDDEPVDADGDVLVRLAVAGAHGQLTADERLSYRSVHNGNRKYCSHVLKTMAHDLAKRYFNLKKKDTYE